MPFEQTNSITHSDAPIAIRFLRSLLPLVSYKVSVLNPIFHTSVNNRLAILLCASQRTLCLCVILSSSSLRPCTPCGAHPATHAQPCLYAPPSPPYTACEAILRFHLRFHPLSRALAVSCLLASGVLSFTEAQQAPQKPAEKPSAKAPAPNEPQNPAQIELLETKIRFEANGDSRKEVHALVHIYSELGVRQFARLNFDYNRSFQSIEIPVVHVTHPGGGTADILPSAITDNPSPAVLNTPAYQDVRVKSVRILGLAPGDNLEYRVITTVTHHPLAPDFWLDHSFDRTGVVSQEIFELDLPASRDDRPDLPRRTPNFYVNSATPVTSTQKSVEGDSARKIYVWDRSAPTDSNRQQEPHQNTEPDVSYSNFGNWDRLSVRLAEELTPGAVPLMSIRNYAESMRELQEKPSVSEPIRAKALELTTSARTDRQKLEAIYAFVSQRIPTVDLPLGSTGFAPRSADEVLSTGYANAEDKFVLFAALAKGLKLHANAALTGYCDKNGVARPSAFNHLVISVNDGKMNYWLDPSLEVAPFGMVSPFLQKCVFVLNRLFFVMNSTGQEWQPFNKTLPFAARQKVEVNASLAGDGKLSAKVHYSMRGDNELLLRVAFHQAAKDKWKELAQLLSLSDGFRGQVTSVSASDPYATHEPFTVDYEITQPKFVNWSKKPVRIPALLPQLGLPDPPAKPAPGAATSPIEVGTPLEVETQMILHLPPGTTAHVPTGTSVQRDYATFASQYSAKGQTVTAFRHIHFLLRQVPADRAADYNAFLRAVLNDEAQDFTLDREAPAAFGGKPAAPVPPPIYKP
jgi:hypothetical protein